jgi:hypothetical protein
MQQLKDKLKQYSAMINDTKERIEDAVQQGIINEDEKNVYLKKLIEAQYHLYSVFPSILIADVKPIVNSKSYEAPLFKKTKE